MKIVIDAAKPLDPDALEVMGQWFGVRGEPGDSLCKLITKRTAAIMVAYDTFFERFLEAEIPLFTVEDAVKFEGEMGDERETEAIL